jgi:hypothetical protein
MQYLLSEQEYKDLQRKDSKFDQLTMLLHKISEDLCNDKDKLKLFRQLVDDLDYSSQDGTTDAILFAWENRK